MPIDRESTLRQAEKLQLQGRLDLAIAEYVRLVEDQPRDWNAINALGDLYLRAGDIDRAVAQFVRIADHLFGEGFFPKAAAVYKKALKARADHEHTLLRLAEIATGQELLADARAYLRRLWELRSERGDDRGAAECLVRLGALPEADAETLLTGARAAKVLGDNERAVALFRTAAGELQKAGRGAAALDALSQVAVLVPSDLALRRELASKFVAAGQLEDAERLLDPETAGTDPDLLLMLASIEVARKDDPSAISTLTRFIVVAPDRSSDVLRLAGERGRAGEPDRAFNCTEVVVDDAVLRGDWDRAVDVLQSFLVHGQYIPALQKLVQVAAEAGHDDVLMEARERLADAYLDNGQGLEAQGVAEALLAGAADSPVHAGRLRRAVELIGVDDPDEVVRRVRGRLHTASMPADAAPSVESQDALFEVVTDSAPAREDAEHVLDDVEPVYVMEPVLDEEEHVHELIDTPAEVPPDREPAVLDLSAAVTALTASQRPRPSPGPPAPMAADGDAVFDAPRPASADCPSVAEAEGLYERGQQRLEDGQVREGLADLQEAARVPAYRFPAAMRLGREYIARGHALAGIEWLERAAEMPAPSRDAALEVLYELGAALESIGESARALAVFMEIESDEPGYRDVRERLAVLARVEDESRR